MLNLIFCSIGIGIISTIIYIIINKNNSRDNNDYIKIFTIISFVSLLILFITKGSNSSEIVLKGGPPINSSNINNVPPF